MYLTVKSNIVFGKFDWAEDQMGLNVGKECDLAEEKKSPEKLNEISIHLPGQNEKR